MQVKEFAMRRIVLTLVGLGMFFCGTNVAMAHGYVHHGHGPAHGHQAFYRGGYYGGWGVGYAPVPIYGSYGSGSGYDGYSYGNYGYAYPQAGFGVAGRNFSLWFQQ
jgi:hypothetical protein